VPRPPEGPQQHDLDPAVAARFVAGCRIRRGEDVLDAGAGTGAITAELLAAGARVACIERDAARVAELRRRFAERASVIQADLARVDPGFAGPWRVVANPPFNLTATLVAAWILGARPPHAVDLILQRETAEKLCAGGTRSGALLACAGAATFVARLPREATSPPSRVDLAVWRFRRDADASPARLRAVDALLARAFAGPRTVAEALRGVASAVQMRRQGAEHAWDPASHPRLVPPRAWLPLADLLAMCGKL
jgi:23S rRNA (adenine-N6)-dimethyltransferase